jgi:integrase
MKSSKINNYVNVINKYAEWKGIEKRYKRVKVRVEDKREKEDYLTEKEILEMIRVSKTIRQKAIIAIMFGTGLRRNEVNELKHKNIDPVTKRIHGVKAKGNKKVNSYFISEYYLNIVKDYALWKKGNKKLKEFTQEDDYFFCNSKGKKLYASTIYYDIKNAAASLEKPGSISPHTLRHSFVYKAMEDGIPQDAISKNLGHSSTKVTESVYTHYTADLQQKRFFGTPRDPGNNITKKMICPECSFNEIEEDFLICPQCQHQFKIKCGGCLNIYKSTFKFCPFCGDSNPDYMKRKTSNILEERKNKN